MYACASDLLDGYLARKFNCTSDPGKVLDLFGDKFLTIAFALYAVARGMPMIPISFIIFREVFLLSIRNLNTDGNPIFKPHRLIGGLTTFPIWFVTFLLLLSVKYLSIDQYYFQIAFWFCGLITLLNLIYKLSQSWSRLILEFKRSIKD